jgi:glycerol-3-phosphate acyltransferase PlsY
MPDAKVLTIICLAYLIGGIPFGFLLVWLLRGVDIRKLGSGNIGATNVGRVLGWHWFPLVFALDFAKGAAPVWAAPRWTSPPQGWSATDLAIAAGISAIIGHMFPIYLGLRGGKGVATSAGVTCLLAPWPFLAAIAAWMCVFFATRYVSLSSLTAALVLVISQIAIAWPSPFTAEERNLTLFTFAGAALVLIRHKSNISRFWQGSEPQAFRRKELTSS